MKPLLRKDQQGRLIWPKPGRFSWIGRACSICFAITSLPTQSSRLGIVGIAPGMLYPRRAVAGNPESAAASTVGMNSPRRWHEASTRVTACPMLFHGCPRKPRTHPDKGRGHPDKGRGLPNKTLGRLIQCPVRLGKPRTHPDKGRGHPDKGRVLPNKTLGRLIQCPVRLGKPRTLPDKARTRPTEGLRQPSR
jgi:hypothetical protein